LAALGFAETAKPRMAQWAWKRAPGSGIVGAVSKAVATAWLCLMMIILGACSSSGSGLRPEGGSRRLAFSSCTTKTAPALALSGVRNEFRSVPGDPFGVVTTPDGRWSFVSLGGSIGLFSDGTFLPRLVREIRVSGRSSGAALTPDGKLLIVTDGGSGAVVVDAGRAERGLSAPIVATLSSPDGSGAVEAAVTPDGHYAFVTLEGSHAIAVFHLMARPLRAGAAFVGDVPVGPAPVGIAVSPDGRWIYATSELGAGRYGVLYVIDLGRAETDPRQSVVSRVVAGCSPVRVATSHDGAIVWVTARGGNELLGFSAAALRGDPRKALIARAYVGPAPVGLIPVDDGRLILVADSNRFGGPNARGDLRVLNSTAMLEGRAAVEPRLAAGAFPREMAVEPNGRTLLVADYGSKQVQAIDLASVP
jgi:DNA-binding beta-propeller fold protein YncE